MWNETKYIFSRTHVWFMKMDYIFAPQKNLSKFPKLEMMHTKLFCIIFKKRKCRSNSYIFFSCLENPRDGRAWWAAVYGVAQSRTRLKWLSSSSSSRKQTESHVEKSQVHEELQAETRDFQKTVVMKTSCIRLYEVKWQLLSCVRLFATLWTIQSMGFSKPEYWSG